VYPELRFFPTCFRDARFVQRRLAEWSPSRRDPGLGKTGPDLRNRLHDQASLSDLLRKPLVRGLDMRCVGIDSYDPVALRKVKR
jgi:hypothetical protein